MTTGSEAMWVLNSESENAIEDDVVDDKTVTNDSKNASPVKKLVDVHHKTVLDEDFRLAVKKLLTGIADLPDNWNDLTVREQRDWVNLKIKGYYSNVPDSICYLCVGYAISGDRNEASAAVPEWLDREKFRRGQRFAMNNFGGVSMGQVVSLYMLFSLDYSLKPLIITNKSSDPFNAFQRYLSTLRRVRNWYSSDVWLEGTDGYRDIQTVRQMHANIRKKLDAMSYLEIDEAATIPDTWSDCREIIREDFRSSIPAPAPGQCPHLLSEDEQFKRPRALNQFEMAATQFGFMGMVLLYPEKFGIHGASNEDLDAFCHVWRGLGYLLGVEDEFNFCKGSIDEVKQRTRDWLEYWMKPNLREISPEWEHMLRCVTVGITYYFPRVTYELVLLYFVDILDIPMPRLQASLRYITRIRLRFIKFTFRWFTRMPGGRAILNGLLKKCTDRALRYTDEELAVLRKRSEIALSEGVAKTIAVKKDLTTAPSKACQQNWFFVFSSASLLLSLPIIVRVCQRDRESDHHTTVVKKRPLYNLRIMVAFSPLYHKVLVTDHLIPCEELTNSEGIANEF